MTYFGTNIKKIRQIKGLSQNSFAELLDLNRGVISSYEDGRAEPKIETVLRIAEYFKIPINDLLSKALTVNQLVNFSELEESIPTVKETINDKLEILTNAAKTPIDLQKIFAKFDFILEVDDFFAKKSIYSVGTILFLQKINTSNQNGMYVVLDKKTLNYSEQFDSKKECYAIVGSLQNGSLTSLEKILLRLEKIESRLK